MKMVPIIGAVLAILATVPPSISQEHIEHRDFQYNSAVDPQTGRYNFAYDTGNDNDIAHSLHMQYQDADGIVRGRYGYTDPRGKLRMVEYEAGPNGFVARGDVGPDQFPHGQAPAPVSDTDAGQEGISSYNELPRGDFDLDPAPIQMSGWDPATDSMNQPQPVDGSALITAGRTTGLESEGLNDLGLLTTVNVTSGNALEVYGPELGFYSDRYPRIIFASADSNNAADPGSTTNPTTSDSTPSNPSQDNNSQTIDNIDVDPDEIRLAAGSPVRRSADGNRAAIVRRSGVQGQATGSQSVRIPASYRNYYSRNYHDHDAEIRSRQTHDHDAEIRSRQTHDHDAEIRSRQTHDHDSERRYRPRQTHDHDAETRYRARQTHDHDAERYQNHDHAAEQAAYYRRLSADRAAYYRSLYRDRGNNYPRRIFYRDSHSMEPHEHYDNPVYRNYRDHQHSDRHLYGRYRNYVYPATAKPRQLKYIPADKYHDKRYYWTYD